MLYRGINESVGSVYAQFARPWIRQKKNHLKGASKTVTQWFSVGLPSHDFSLKMRYKLRLHYLN